MADAAQDPPGNEPGVAFAWWIVAGAAACGLALLLSLSSARTSRGWEVQARARARELRGEAERLVVGGKLDEAYRKYQDAAGVVEGRPVRDPALRRELDRAREGRERVFKAILEGRLEPATRKT